MISEDACSKFLALSFGRVFLSSLVMLWVAALAGFRILPSTTL